MANDIVGWAQAGSFRVDTTTARAMMMSIGQVRQQLEDRLRRIAYLKRQAELGDLPEARRIAELDADVASGDHQALEYALQRFHEALDKAHQALEIGMRNYEQIEAQSKAAFRQAGGG